jgi:hypothetical protein
MFSLILLCTSSTYPTMKVNLNQCGRTSTMHVNIRVLVCDFLKLLLFKIDTVGGGVHLAV